jgi:hypothetical protein
MWEAAELIMKEEIRQLESEMEKFLDDLAEEKVNGTLEINSKFDNELKNMEDNVDLSI